MSKRQEVVNAREVQDQHKNEIERLKSQILERQTENTFLERYLSNRILLQRVNSFHLALINAASQHVLPRSRNFLANRVFRLRKKQILKQYFYGNLFFYSFIMKFVLQSRNTLISSNGVFRINNLQPDQLFLLF
jgi:hypothetical protein